MVRWGDFVDFMKHLGVEDELIDKRGSAHRFFLPEHLRGESTEHIVFHEPHGEKNPKQEVHKIVTRDWGRQLHNKYGWRREMFVIE